MQVLDNAEMQFRSRVERIVAQKRIVVDSAELTRAAVLVPIVFRSGNPQLILTVRTMTLAQHKGQIAFPGGVTEPSDTSPTFTALREAQEEIGLDPASVCVAGLLDDVATITGFAITPVAGLVAPDATFTLDPKEVERVFEVRMADFRDPSNHTLMDAEHQGKHAVVHRYDVDGNVVWGATALIIHRFLSAYEKACQEEILSGK